MDVTLKVLVVGNGNCGKSSLLSQFTRGTIAAQHIKTIGTEYYEKSVYSDETGEQVKLLLWDTAGQDQFSSLTHTYYTGASAVIFLFSTVDRASFEAITAWYNRVNSVVNTDSCIYVLVQNKIDLLQQSAVSPAEVEALARTLNIKLYRTCVKQNLHVSDIFDYIVNEYMVRGNSTNTNALQSIDTYNVQHNAVHSVTNAYTVQTEAAASPTSNAENNAGTANTAAVATAAETAHARKGSVFDKHGSATSSQTMSRTRLQPVTQRTGGKKKGDCSVM